MLLEMNAQINAYQGLGTFLLTWFNFNPIMDK